MLILGKRQFVFSLLIIIGLSACESTTKPPAHPISNEVKPIYVAQAGLTDKQRFTKALDYLENGQEGQAKVELQAYLNSIPTSKSAKDLLAQIEMDPLVFFPQESFTVALKSGESLSTLSKTYLGSALKFYALAKYNHITNPSRVNIGQAINIPMTSYALKKREQEQQEQLNGKSDKQAVTDVAQNMANEQSESIKAVNSAAKTAEKIKELTVAQVKVVETRESVQADIKQALDANDFVLAQQKVDKLKSFGELNKETRPLVLKTLLGDGTRLTASNKPLAASRFAQAAQLYIQDNDSLSAFENLRKASNLDPANDQVMEDMLILQKEISDKYHREASSAYRRQELDLAIEKWNKVLEIDPEHSSAKLYRAQAMELKERLKKLNN